MALASALKTRILVGDFAYSGYARSVETASDLDMLDATVFTDTAKTFVAGPGSGKFVVSGLSDHTGLVLADANTALSAASEIITVGMNGFAAGEQVWMANGVAARFVERASVNGLVEYDLEATPSGPIGFGVSLHDLSAETADSNAAGVDGTAQTLNGGVAHLHVTAFSGFSGAVVTIEDSSNGSSWGSPIATFTTVAGVTAQRVTIAGTIKRHTRCSVDVTGSGSITFSVAIARF